MGFVHAFRLAAVVLAAVLIVGCGSKTPTAPTASSIAGTWTGSFADNIVGINPTTWTIQQSGSSATATFTIQTSATTGRGTTQGTVSGSSVQWTGTIPVGGYPAPFQNCSQTASGTLTVSGTRMSGPYTLQSGAGCSPPNLSTTGTLTLNKQ